MGPEFIAAIILYTNALRAKPLHMNADLNARAQVRAQYLCNAPFSHDFFEIFFGGGKYKYQGENLAKDFTTAKGVVDAWKKSPTHRANMVASRYNQVGVGRAQCDGFNITVELLGTL